jgi:hypothetical protein
VTGLDDYLNQATAETIGANTKPHRGRCEATHRARTTATREHPAMTNVSEVAGERRQGSGRRHYAEAGIIISNRAY